MTSMANAKLLRCELLLNEPKRFVREVLLMPDGFQLDWFYVDRPPGVLVVPVTARVSWSWQGPGKVI